MFQWARGSFGTRQLRGKAPRRRAPRETRCFVVSGLLTIANFAFSLLKSKVAPSVVILQKKERKGGEENKGARKSNCEREWCERCQGKHSIDTAF